MGNRQRHFIAVLFTDHTSLLAGQVSNLAISPAHAVTISPHRPTYRQKPHKLSFVYCLRKVSFNVQITARQLQDNGVAFCSLSTYSLRLSQ